MPAASESIPIGQYDFIEASQPMAGRHFSSVRDRMKMEILKIPGHIAEVIEKVEISFFSNPKVQVDLLPHAPMER